MEPREKPTIQTKDLVIAKAVEVIAGSGADTDKKAWVEANIRSIREAVQDGRHSTLYYPASGADILRPLVAYHADHCIVIDTDKHRMGESERQIRELGIQPEVQTSDDGKRREIIFELEGRPRKITEVQEDVRLISPRNFGLEQVDVLHIYAPTGATGPITEEEVYLKKKHGDEWFYERWPADITKRLEKDPNAPKPDPETGEYKTVFEGMGSKLTVTNYQTVSESGFFVFGEGRFSAYDFPPVLLEMVGLEEKQITSRHPYTILTSFFPNQEEMETINRAGYIYQKVRTVNPGVIEAFNDAISSNFGTYYGFMEFERGNWGGLGLTKEAEMDVQTAINKQYVELQQEIAALGERFAQAGVETSMVERFKTETLERYKAKVLGLKQQLAELLQAYGEMSQRYNAGGMSDQEAIEFMGIVIETDRWGNTEYENTKWPLAAQLLLEGEEKSRQTYELASQFVDVTL